MNRDDPFLRHHAARLDALARLATPAGRTAGVLVALSGGPDSTALLLTAVAWRETGGGPVTALHVHHGLRGPDSDADAAFCAELCRHLAVPLTTRRVDTRATATARGRGVEEAARHLRRQMVRETLDTTPRLTCCALGHHRDDQLETILLRLFRGTGLDGLAAMRPVRDRLVRPFLDTPRREIIAFLERAGQPFRRDRSNITGENLRSRVRHQVLPLLREVFGPSFAHGPLRLAALAAEESDLLHALAAGALTSLRRHRSDGSLPAAALADLPAPLARRVLLRWLGETARDMNREPPVPGRRQWERLLAWIPRSRSGTACDLCDGWRVARAFDGLAVLPPSRGPAAPRPVLCVDRNGAPAPADAPHALTLPAAALQGRPRLRLWRAGDRLETEPGRSLLVGDLLQQHRIPWYRRATVQVVTDDAGLLWIPGLAAAARTRILPGSGPTVTLRVEPAPPSRRP